jgi:hypothetical protein
LSPNLVVVPSDTSTLEVLRRPLESTLAALVGVQDHPGDRVLAAPDRDGHRQRGVGQCGVVMLGQGEADDAPRAHVQHRGQV